VIKYQKVPDQVLIKNSSLLNSTPIHHQQIIQALMRTRYYSPVNSIVNTVDVNAKKAKEEDGDETNSYRVQEETVDATHRSFIIKNLEEWTSYRVTVTASTKIGLGPPSPDIILRTDESGMSYDNAAIIFCFCFNIILASSYDFEERIFATNYPVLGCHSDFFSFFLVCMRHPNYFGPPGVDCLASCECLTCLSLLLSCRLITKRSNQVGFPSNPIILQLSLI
jgi:hypothetical protein